MDERRLTTVPRGRRLGGPPGAAGQFDHADVLAGSRRAQARARRLQTGSIALAVLGLATAGVLSAGCCGPRPLRPRWPGGAGPHRGWRALPAGAARRRGAVRRRAGLRHRAVRRTEAGRVGQLPVPDQRLFGSWPTSCRRCGVPRPAAVRRHLLPERWAGLRGRGERRGAHGELRVLLSRGTIGGGSSVQTGGGSMSTSTSSTRDGGSLSVTTMSTGAARRTRTGWTTWPTSSPARTEHGRLSRS